MQLDTMSERPMDNWGNSQRFRGLRPARRVIVPQEYLRATYARERERNYYTWKYNTGCEILAYGRYNKITRFEVFGAKVDQAVKEINEWIMDATTKSAESTAWAKIKAFDANEFGYDRLRAWENQRKQMFNGPIPEELDLIKVSQ
jgi:hypothetical protein